MQTNKRQDGDWCEFFKKITTSEGKALFLELLVLVSREVKKRDTNQKFISKECKYISRAGTMTGK